MGNILESVHACAMARALLRGGRRRRNVDMRCDSCNSLLQNAANAKRHERLRQVGLTQRIARPGHGRAAWITFHVCDACMTYWRHLDDVGNARAGWSLEQGSLPMCD